MMDDKVLNAQCTDIAKCINGLCLSLTEADGTPTGISKILNDVHKLIKSFRVLGNYYADELVKKCRELEAKNKEVETLSRKLQQFEADSNIGHSIPKPDCQLDGQKRQRREVETRADPHGRSVSELSERHGDLFKGAEKNDSQCFKTKSAQVERSGEDSTFQTGTLYGSQNETGKGKERKESPAVANRPLSRVQLKDPKHFEDSSRLESDPKGCLHFKNSSSHFACDHERKNIDQVSETMQRHLVQEQSAVDNLCGLMKDYQDVFFEKAVGASDFKNVIYLSPKKLRGDYQQQVSLQQTTLPHPAYIFQR